MSDFARRATIVFLAVVMLMGVGPLRGTSSLDPASEAALTGVVLLAFASLLRRTQAAGTAPARLRMPAALRPQPAPHPKPVV